MRQINPVLGTRAPRRALLRPFVVFTLLWMLLPPAAADVLSARVVGRLDRFPTEITKKYGQPEPDDTAIINSYGMPVLMPEQNLLVQVFLRGDFQSVLLVRDLQTLSPKKVIEIDGEVLTVGVAGAQWINAYDPRGGRLFLAVKRPSLVQGYYTLDARTLRAAYSDLPLRDMGVALAGQTILGLTYDARTSRLYAVLAQHVSPLFHPTTTQDTIPNNLIAMDAAGAAPHAVEYVRQIRSCRSFSPVQNAISGDRHPVPVLSTRDADGVWRLHVPCGVRNSVVGVVRFNADPQVVNGIAADTAESSVVGPPNVYNILADRPSGRLVMIAQAGDFERVGWVYDANAASFIGVFRASGQGETCVEALLCQSFGMDERNGRFLGLAQGLGLYSSAIRLNPVPQADSYQGYPVASGNKAIVYDPRNDRIFVLRPDPAKSRVGDERYLRHYDIVELDAPAEEPEAVDPDRFTVNHAEGEQTSVSFAASGSAYGVRMLLARGVNGANPAPDALNDNANRIAHSRCGFTDRSVVFGRIDTSTLSDSAAGARAVEFDVDSRTRVDLEKPTRCDTASVIPTLNNALFGGPLREVKVGEDRLPDWLDKTVGRPWGYKPAECLAADDRRESGQEPGDPDFGGAVVDCQFGRQEVAAASEARVDLGVVRALDSETTLRIERTPGKGATTTVTSVVRGLRIGSIAIGEVETIAYAAAGGRPGTAAAKFARTIRGVNGPGLPPNASCTNDGCNQLVTLLNAALGGRGQFRLPEPDPALCADRKANGDCSGSDGGAQAGVLKSAFQRESDNALSGDSSYEIPGLELIVYNDQPSLGRARQLFQIAGVRADASYNISLLPSFGGPDTPVGPGGLEPPIGPVGGFEPPIDPVGITPPDLGSGNSGGNGGGLLDPVFQPVADGLRLFVTDPKGAVRNATAWILLVGPLIMAARRRKLRSLAEATSQNDT